jgi:tRNA nucleotidyltransferase (CCA-adding enzyme)
VSLEQEILKRISPSEAEREAIDQKVGSLLEKVKEEADREGDELSVLLVGSVAKDTFLREPDLDVFILFRRAFPGSTWSRSAWPWAEECWAKARRDTLSIPTFTDDGAGWRWTWSPATTSRTPPI